MLRIAQIIITAVAGLLVVPVAVNIGTGGQAPGWLQPYVDWLWPVALVGVAVVVALEILTQRRDLAGVFPRRPPDPRNVRRALDQVQRYVEGRQRGSLTGRLRIALALDERPASVRQPVHLVQRVSGTEFRLSAESDIADVFSMMDESMLLLGAPGAGKTTQLLDLADALVARARRGIGSTAIPVLVDLAEWSRSGVPRFSWFGSRDRGPVDFVEWLLGTLERRYHIPESVGRAWLEENRLILLLDGLDEVREADRAQCVRAINNLQEQHGTTRLAVCCRVADYHRLTEQFRLQGAVEIRLLTRQQVDHFLRALNPRLSGVAVVLAVDDELWELLTTPLMLTIMVIAEEGRTVAALAEGADAAERRRLLFDAYVVEVLARRRVGDEGEPVQTLRALRMLAGASVGLDSGVRIEPFDYESAPFLSAEVADAMRLWLRPLTAFLAALAAVAVAGRWLGASAAWGVAAAGVLLQLAVASGVAPSARVAIARPGILLLHVVVVGVFTGVTMVGPFGLVGPLSGSRPWTPAAAALGLAILVAAVYLGAAWHHSRKWRLGLWIVAVGTLIAASVAVLDPPSAATEGWALGIGHGVCTVVVVVTATLADRRWSGADVPRAWRYGIGFCLLTVLAVPGLSSHETVDPLWVLLGWGVGFAYGFFPGVVVGLALLGVYLQSATAIIAERNPWRRSFLRFAADRSLLTFVDGEYRFVHLLVRDHLAACDPESLGEAVLRRRAELSTTPQAGAVPR